MAESAEFCNPNMSGSDNLSQFGVGPNGFFDTSLPILDTTPDNTAKRPRCTRSKIWQHFTIQEKDPDRANCNHCGNELGCKSSSAEKEGFRFFMSKAFPRFNVPSRKTMYRDVMALYKVEKAKLKQYFIDSRQTVCLTTDCWTSSKLQGYMVLTGHYITPDWKLQKKILSFVLVDGHKGEEIGKSLDNLLIEWDIEKVCTITVDNASSNDTCLNYMKSSLTNRGCTIAKGVHHEYALHDPNFKIELAKTGVDPTQRGAPTHGDWVYIREFKQFLQHFYDLTNKVSGTKYVTANTFFEEIAAVNYLLDEWSEHVICDDDAIFKNMAAKMKDKYEKYWGDPEKMNKYIFIAAILDPRTKESHFFKDLVEDTYGNTKGNAILTATHMEFVSLFVDYKKLYGSPTSEVTAQSETSHNASENSLMRARYNKRM
ncbi:unnamed protein product [Alopecurus aequalis]